MFVAVWVQLRGEGQLHAIFVMEGQNMKEKLSTMKTNTLDV